ncbi:hypothetical protein ACH437_30565 [Streptomyces xinghaiensis]|uniref:hypothetical protein n=1 Tax=Streptomyces xinghaiensis TaxID=1038928 RepID=UPI0037ABB98B
MDGFINGLDRSLQEENWYAALAMSLTLPDICVKASDLSKRTTGPKYAVWFDENVGHKYRRPVGADRQIHVFLSGNDCYALRCAFLHAGSADISAERIRETLGRFYFCMPGRLNNRWHLNQRNDALILMVDEFAADVLEAARLWWERLEPARRDAARRTHLVLQDTDGLTGF